MWVLFDNFFFLFWCCVHFTFRATVHEWTIELNSFFFNYFGISVLKQINKKGCCCFQAQKASLCSFLWVNEWLYDSIRKKTDGRMSHFYGLVAHRCYNKGDGVTRKKCLGVISWNTEKDWQKMSYLMCDLKAKMRDTSIWVDARCDPGSSGIFE